MRFIAKLLLPLSLVLAWHCGTNAAPVVAQEPPLKVLFIGNSYIYVNDLPGMIVALADAAGGRKIEIGQRTPGGYLLQQHLQDGKAAAEIARRNWDVVVLQEQSLMPLADPKRTYEAAQKLDALVRKQGAKTVLYLTWARQEKPKTQATLNAVYLGIAKNLGAAVAPVGMAWRQALQADPKLTLYASDGSHPSPAGSYLAACVFYATLLGKNPEGLPGTLVNADKPLAKIAPAEAKQLQAIAWQTVRDLAKNN